jgi:Domain of unknown function (DUF4326)
MTHPHRPTPAFPTLEPIIVHVNDPDGWDLYIGRATPRARNPNAHHQSIWHNQYRIGAHLPDGTTLNREGSLTTFGHWLDTSTEPRAQHLRRHLHALAGKRLACWCTKPGRPLHIHDPLTCHGQVLGRRIPGPKPTIPPDPEHHRHHQPLAGLAMSITPRPEPLDPNNPDDPAFWDWDAINEAERQSDATVRPIGIPPTPNTRPCRICGLACHLHHPCPVCHGSLEHDHSPEQTKAEWEGLARLAAAGLEAGRALSSTETEALQRHPNRHLTALNGQPRTHHQSHQATLQPSRDDAA